MQRFTLIIIVSLAVFLTGCATGGFDSAQKTQQLQRGMHYDEVVALLGEPQATTMNGNKLLARFGLHQSWKGNVVYDLTFNANNRRLEGWTENKMAYAQNQAQLGQLAKALEQATASGQGADAATPMGPNDARLQQQIAGTWWGYAGSTERKLGLCADGRYRDYTESGYSGSSYDSGGNQTMAWGSASQRGGSGRWIINGNTQNGTISVNYAGGGSTQIRYRQVGEPGCLDFNGAKLCRSSASCE